MRLDPLDGPRLLLLSTRNRLIFRLLALIVRRHGNQASSFPVIYQTLLVTSLSTFTSHVAVISCMILVHVVDDVKSHLKVNNRLNASAAQSGRQIAHKANSRTRATSIQQRVE